MKRFCAENQLLRNFDRCGFQLLIEKVFKQKLMDYSLTGYISGAEKFNYKIPKLNGALIRSLRLIKKVRPNLYYKLAKKLHHPAEINFVIKKVK